MVVLSDPFGGMGATLTVGPRSRPEPEMKNGSSAEDEALERLRCGKIQAG